VTDVALTPHEQRALATIEDGLGADDPGLATALRRGRPVSELRRWVRPAGVLVALSVVLAAHPLVVELDVLGVGLLTGVLVLPWLVYAAWRV
jgi:Protein of unknown function (DUF3040)